MIRLLLIAALILMAAQADAQIGLPAGLAQLRPFTTTPPPTGCTVEFNTAPVELSTGVVEIHC